MSFRKSESGSTRIIYIRDIRLTWMIKTVARTQTQIFWRRNSYLLGLFLLVYKIKRHCDVLAGNIVIFVLWREIITSMLQIQCTVFTHDTRRVCAHVHCLVRSKILQKTKWFPTEKMCLCCIFVQNNVQCDLGRCSSYKFNDYAMVNIKFLPRSS